MMLIAFGQQFEAKPFIFLHRITIVADEICCFFHIPQRF